MKLEDKLRSLARRFAFRTSLAVGTLGLADRINGGYFEDTYNKVVPTFDFNQYAGDVNLESLDITLTEGDEVGAFLESDPYNLMGVFTITSQSEENGSYGGLPVFSNDEMSGNRVIFNFYDQETQRELHNVTQSGEDTPAIFYGNGDAFTDLNLTSSTRMFGDANDDQDVDLEDFTGFQNCYTGPKESQDFQGIGIDCNVFDFEYDGDVDQHDYGKFMTSFTGSEE